MEEKMKQENEIKVRIVESILQMDDILCYSIEYTTSNIKFLGQLNLQRL